MIVDLVPFIMVSDVARSIAFYEALGFAEVKRHEANGRLEFAGMEASPAAKVMLARVDEVPAWDPDESSPGFLCCACGTRTGTATWSRSCSRGPSGASRRVRLRRPCESCSRI